MFSLWIQRADFGSRQWAVSSTSDAVAAFEHYDWAAELRYLVIPMRPQGTDGWSEDRLADLVTRDSMVGTGLPKRPDEATR